MFTNAELRRMRQHLIAKGQAVAEFMDDAGMFNRVDLRRQRRHLRREQGKQATDPRRKR